MAKRKPLTEEQRERERETRRIWRARNKEAIKASREKYNNENREKVRARNKEWRTANRAYVLAYLKEYRDSHRVEKIKKPKAEKVKKPKAIKIKVKAKDAGNAAAEIRMRMLGSNEIFAAAERAVSRGIQPWKRDDIIADIVLAVLEGSLQLEEIPRRAKEYVARFNREFSEHRHIEFNEEFMSNTD